MNPNNTAPSTDRITHVVYFYTRKQDFTFPAHSLIELHQLLQACQQMEGEKPQCMRWKTHQWISQLIKTIEKHDKNSWHNDCNDGDKLNNPQDHFSPQLLDSLLPNHPGLRGKWQMLTLRCRYSFAYHAFIGCLLLPKNIYVFWQYQRERKRKIQQFDAEFNAAKKSP